MPVAANRFRGSLLVRYAVSEMSLSVCVYTYLQYVCVYV